MGTFLKSLAILIISFFLWISIFELISTWWIEKYGDPLDKTKQVLVTDRYLGWRQKPDFKGKFLNIALKTNEIGLRNKSFSKISNASKNVLVLGPSSTFGWGVEGYQTYSAALEDLLRKKYPGTAINVINAGQIGFSSWQGLQLYKEEGFKKFKADVLIIAYGVNDVDRYRFFYASPLADKQEFAVPKRAWEVSLQNFLLRFDFISLLSRKTVNFFDYFSFSRKVISSRRVSNDDFARNIEKLIQMGKLNGAKVILLNSVYNLPAFKKAVIKINPDDFEKARQLEPGRIANDIDGLNNILRKIANKNDVILVDTKECLSGPGLKGMFLDPIHFSVMGNERLAEEILDVIDEHHLLGTDQEKGSE